MSTHIDGIILTQKAKATLRRAQNEDNSLLKSSIEDLTVLAKKICVEEAFNTGREKEALNEIATLFSICEILESLCAYEADEHE